MNPNAIRHLANDLYDAREPGSTERRDLTVAEAEFISAVSAARFDADKLLAAYEAYRTAQEAV